MDDPMNGNPVLIDPDFLDDPHGRAGQVGMLGFVDPERDEVLVSFDDGQYWLYSSDALLVLKPRGEVYKDTLNNFREMTPDDFKTLLKIGIAQDAGTQAQLWNAMNLAAAVPGVRPYSLERLEDRLKNALALSEGFKTPPVISR